MTSDVGMEAKAVDNGEFPVEDNAAALYTLLVFALLAGIFILFALYTLFRCRRLHKNFLVLLLLIVGGFLVLSASELASSLLTISEGERLVQEQFRWLFSVQGGAFRFVALEHVLLGAERVTAWFFGARYEQMESPFWVTIASFLIFGVSVLLTVGVDYWQWSTIKVTGGIVGLEIISFIGILVTIVLMFLRYREQRALATVKEHREALWRELWRSLSASGSAALVMAAVLSSTGVQFGIAFNKTAGQLGTVGIGEGIALCVAAIFWAPTITLILDELRNFLLCRQEITQRGGIGVVKYVDHKNQAEVKAFFDELAKENGGALDILVNNAYSAVKALTENAGKPFYETDPEIWDEINDVGLRNHYFCTVYAARLMVPRRSGLIVNISSFGGLKYFFSVPYGVGKQAVDRLAADAAHELKDKGVTVVSIWPGVVRTELLEKTIRTNAVLQQAAQFRNRETTEFAGLGIAHLAADPKRHAKTGRVFITSELAREYGFTDVDGEAKFEGNAFQEKILRRFARCQLSSSLLVGRACLNGCPIGFVYHTGL